MMLSIIIPMYNVAQYLEKCIANVNIETIDYEILMINDGSPDNSLEIANRLKEINSIIKILSQENKGLGGARNLGIKNATGKYILFLDADDVLILQNFLFLNNEQSQVIQLGSYCVDEKNNILSKYIPNNIKNISGVDFWLNNIIFPSACNKLYNREFLLKNKLFFKEHIYSEDIEFNTRVFLKVDFLNSYPLVIQNFIQTSGSITRNKNKDQKLKLYKDLLYIVDHFLILKKQNLNKDVQLKFLDKIISDIVLGVINMAIKLNIANKDIYTILYNMKKNNIPIFSINYDNRNKNIFKYLLQIPYSLSLLKLIIK